MEKQQCSYLKQDQTQASGQNNDKLQIQNIQIKQAQKQSKPSSFEYNNQSDNIKLPIQSNYHDELCYATAQFSPFNSNSDDIIQINPYLSEKKQQRKRSNIKVCTVNLDEVQRQRLILQRKVISNTRYQITQIKQILKLLNFTIMNEQCKELRDKIIKSQIQYRRLKIRSRSQKRQRNYTKLKRIQTKKQNVCPFKLQRAKTFYASKSDPQHTLEIEYIKILSQRKNHIKRDKKMIQTNIDKHTTSINKQNSILQKQLNNINKRIAETTENIHYLTTKFRNSGFQQEPNQLNSFYYFPSIIKQNKNLQKYRKMSQGQSPAAKIQCSFSIFSRLY